MGDLIDGKMFANISLGGLPDERAFGRVKFDQKGSMTLSGSEGGSVGD